MVQTRAAVDDRPHKRISFHFPTKCAFVAEFNAR
jgi:hypothetical protein